MHATLMLLPLEELEIWLAQMLPDRYAYQWPHE